MLYTGLFTLAGNASRTLTRRNAENARLYEETRWHLVERRRTQEALQNRSDLANLVMSISTDFLNLTPGEVNEGISDALR